MFFKKEEKVIPKNQTKVISNIEKYGYTLDDRDTKYMEETFKELEKILNAEEINEEEYAKSLSKLFIIDFFTLSNKINKYDVGSLEYILNEKQEMFKSKAMDEIYRDIIDNTYKDRVQELPEITSVEVIDIKEDKYKYQDKELDCFKVNLKYAYKKDLGYDKSGNVYLIRNNNKLEIVKYETQK